MVYVAMWHHQAPNKLCKDMKPSAAVFCKSCEGWWSLGWHLINEMWSRPEYRYPATKNVGSCVDVTYSKLECRYSGTKDVVDVMWSKQECKWNVIVHAMGLIRIACIQMWGKIIIPMYRLWLHCLYGLYGPRCPLSPKRPINLISLSL